jgi:hypothetical protein
VWYDGLETGDSLILLRIFRGLVCLVLYVFGFGLVCLVCRKIVGLFPQGRRSGKDLFGTVPTAEIQDAIVRNMLGDILVLLLHGISEKARPLSDLI